MRLYQLKNKFNIKKTIRIIAFIISFILIILYFRYLVNPIIVSVSEIKVKSLSIQAINNSVSEVVAESALYNDLIKIITNKDGDIVSIQANTILINSLSKDLAKVAQNKIEQLGNIGVNIPLGTFSGMPIFVGRGPNVKIKILPIGAISCEFYSKFTGNGINQTYHRIYVNVRANVTIILPTARHNIDTETSVLLCESIIVGKVPDTYLHSDSVDQMLNLV
jgi:sporulation protein YunB